MKKILIFLSESLQSSSLDSEAFQLFKSVKNDDDIQIPDLEKKLVEENGFVILTNILMFRLYKPIEGLVSEFSGHS